MPVGKQCRCGRVAPTLPCQKCKAAKEKVRAREEDKSVRFHQSTEWTNLSRDKRMMSPLCERCDHQDRTTPATEVHHIKSVKKHPQLKTEWSNLISLCSSCHHAVHRNEPLLPDPSDSPRKVRKKRRLQRP